MAQKCTAKSKQSGERCKRWATPGASVCSSHGSKSLSGPASPSWVTGKYSKVLPQRLVARYEAALNDPGLLDLTRDIAAVTLGIEEALSALPEDAPKSASDNEMEIALWTDITQLHLRRAKLTEVQFRREVALGVYLPVAEILALSDAIIGIVLRYVPDRKIQSAIASEIREVQNRVYPGAQVLVRQ